MAIFSVAGFSGNITRPSRTRSFVDHLTGQTAAALHAPAFTFDIADLGATFGAARSLTALDDEARKLVERFLGADLIVVGTPTYKGSYTGLFKHFFDLLDPSSLRGKAILIAATGGGDRHSLMVEHQLRPLFGFFEAHTLPTAIYASERDLADCASSSALKARIAQALGEAQRLLGAPSTSGSRLAASA